MENENKEKKKISSIVRYVIGGFFVLSIFGMTGKDVMACLFLALFGVSLFPAVYDKFLYSKFKLNKNSFLHIIIPVLLFLIACVCIPASTENNTENTINNTVNNTVNQNVVEEKNEVVNEVVEEKDEKDEEETTSKETTQQDKTSTVKDNSSSETTKKEEVTTPSAPKQETPKQEATTPSVPPVVEQPKEESKPSNESTSSSSNSNSSSNSGSSSNSQETVPTPNSSTVYRTPTGKRYHLDPDCGGKNSRATTLDSAISSGLTPCQKCAM